MVIRSTTATLATYSSKLNLPLKGWLLVHNELSSYDGKILVEVVLTRYQNITAIFEIVATLFLLAVWNSTKCVVVLSNEISEGT
jgi:hypothetical protein